MYKITFNRVGTTHEYHKQFNTLSELATYIHKVDRSRKIAISMRAIMNQLSTKERIILDRKLASLYMVEYQAMMKAMNSEFGVSLLT